MTRFERVRAIAAKYDVSLAEYLLVHIATAFAMTPGEAIASLTTMLAKTPYANLDGAEAFKRCAEKGLVTISPAGLLKLTEAGMVLAHAIAIELTAGEEPEK
jgi:hypothetical protein